MVRRNVIGARACALLALVSSTVAAQEVEPPKEAPVAGAAPSTEPPPPPKGLQWQAGEFTVKLGGYIKLDLIHDFDEIGSTDSFDPRTIPVGEVDDPSDATRLHARQTRINVDVRGPASGTRFRAFVEGDFFSDQNGFRVRHAYGVIDSLLGGQTWSTFMDDEAMPETIDFETPVAYPMIRQGQVRWTHTLDDGSYWALALEDPDSDVLFPDGTGQSEEPMPDLNARLHWKNSRGHVQLGLFGGMARFDPTTGSPEDAALWGLNLSTKLTTFDEDNAIVQITYGDGVGRYRGGTTAVVDSDGDLDAVPTLGIMLSYQHHWSKDYRSTVAYSFADGDLPDGAPATATDALEYLAANLIWQFDERVWTGIEYLYGSRETFDGAEGEAHRVQIALRFNL